MDPPTISSIRSLTAISSLNPQPMTAHLSSSFPKNSSLRYFAWTKFALPCPTDLFSNIPRSSLKTLSPGGYRARCSNPLMMELLRRVEPLDMNGQRKRHWAICGDCSRYRPTSHSYWESRRRDSVLTGLWKWQVENWSILSPQCPEMWGRICLPECPECWCEDLEAFKKW